MMTTVINIRRIRHLCSLVIKMYHKKKKLLQMNENLDSTHKTVTTLKNSRQITLNDFILGTSILIIYSDNNMQ